MKKEQESKQDQEHKGVFGGEKFLYSYLFFARYRVRIVPYTIRSIQHSIFCAMLNVNSIHDI